MEEDSVVKAPVTRLRRRLSVELSEDAKSPATPSTPTKKRGARLAAKPQLELIDEDTPQNTKRTTRKAKEPAEPVEEKVATPARRSTRVKSNTSLVLESVQAVDSPRAKRAARRNSQVGSDNEIPGTPVKAARTPARRTRNNSTSSVDKASAPGTPVKTPGRTTRRTASSADKQGDNESFSQNSQEIQNNVKSIITEVIAEEPEQELRKSRSKEATNIEKSPDSSPSSVRKSPRLMEKKHRKSVSDSKDETSTIEENTPDENNGLNDEKDKTKHDQKTETGASKLSTSSVDLIRELDVKPKRKSSAANQSLSAIDDNSKTRKQRTKSWTTISSPTVNDNFYSDNESSKKKIKNTKGASNFLAINTGSGDGTDSGRNNESENSKTPTTRKKVSSESSFSVENIHTSLILPSPRQSEKHDKSLNETAKPVDISNNSNKENLFSSNKLNAELLFQKSPGKDLQAQVFIEDSDSNTEPTEKPNDIQTTDVEDQCVPQVIHEDNLGEKDTNVEATDKNKSTNIFNLESSPNNDTCEPMDVDVTIPENIQLNNSIEKSFLNKSKRKMSLNDSINSKIKNKSEEIPIKNHESSHYIPQESTINENNNKSKRKSSLNDSINKKAEEDQNKGTRTSLIDSLQETNDLNESKKSKRKLSLTDSINKRDTSNVTTDERLTKNSTLSTSQIVMDVSINKSKRKSSVSNSMSQDLEKSGNQNKSTLVLSQLKDDSSIENNTSKHLSENKAEFLKTSATNTPKEVVVNKNLSINYSTSTPVQQKNVKNLAMHMNTSIISPSIESDKMGSGKQNKSKDKESTVESSESDSTNESDEEDSKEKTYLDDQADEASDDYESGDSQDESERLYEKEHEIIDKGTTLTSEEEMSDDTDYEKDSFVVSSDEEDNDLLSGSGDDLDMSDNELTMNPKSKKKYDERSRKLQKKASKEMFEARHKLDKPDKTSKNKLSDSTQESETEIMAPPKKNKRMRLDSNWDSSTVDENDSKELDNNVPVLENEANKKKKKSKQLSESQSENENRDSTMNESNTSNIGRKKNKKAKLLLESTSESIVEGENTESKAVSVTNNSMERTSGNKKKKAKRLSESMSNEKEITICNDTVTDQEDPLLKAIKQEVKTPQKDLDISTINFTVREELEQVHVNENISLLKANDTVDPLHDTLVDGGSDDSSISENEELMKDYDNVLNNLNKIGTKKIKTHDTSLNLDKKEKKARDSIIDKLNITQTNTKNKNKSKATVVKKANMVQDDNTNDSIDIKLLFSEDSNDSEAIKKQKPETQDDSYIPLKRTEAKTNISLKEADNIFFVDTEGTLADNSVNKLLNNISISGNEDTAPSKKENESPESDDAPIEISFKKDKAQDKNEQNKSTNEVAVLETSVGKKKKKKLSESMNVGKTDAAPIPTKNISLDSKKQGKTVTSLLTVTEIVNKDRNIPGSHDNEKRNLKRKRRLSTEDVGDANTSKKSNNSFMQADLHKKRKLSNQNEETSQKSKDKVNEDQEVAQMNDQENSLMGKQKNKSLTNESVATSQVTAPTTETDSKKKRKKRKRDDTENDKVSKMMKENSLDNVHVPRLPSTIINQLEDKPRQDILKARKSTIISTTDFHVEEAKKRRNKPSNYLEESVYLNLEPEGPVKKKKYDNRKPKVLPFTPTASTSDSGFTTKFQVNVIPQKVEFTAQSTHVTDFKSNYLQERRKKKLNTFDLYKHQRHLKLSKF